MYCWIEEDEDAGEDWQNLGDRSPISNEKLVPKSTCCLVRRNLVEAKRTQRWCDLGRGPSEGRTTLIGGRLFPSPGKGGVIFKN